MQVSRESKGIASKYWTHKKSNAINKTIHVHMSNLLSPDKALPGNPMQYIAKISENPPNFQFFLNRD